MISSSNAVTKIAAAFDARFATAHRQELPLCGDGFLPHPRIELVKLRTSTRGAFSARKRDGGYLEIELPTAINVKGFPEDEAKRISTVISRAFGRDIKVNFVGSGGKVLIFVSVLCVMAGSAVNLLPLEDGLIEIDANEDLKSLIPQDSCQLMMKPSIVPLVFTWLRGER
ncbi:hypothetical protein H0H92_005535 [Tricholoma furcatifolium]|nr:hypothetical protein H0H92_005535 [Tricholoma furcatifolium]